MITLRLAIKGALLLLAADLRLLEKMLLLDIIAGLPHSICSGE
jgi:hypothetical protein